MNNTKLLPENMTIGEKYSPAMEITNAEVAKEYFESLVEHTMRLSGLTRLEAEQIERTNLGYFAGYYGHEVRLRVERLFSCTHPIFGSVANGAPTLEEAIEAGKRKGAKQ